MSRWLSRCLFMSLFSAMTLPQVLQQNLAIPSAHTFDIILSRTAVRSAQGKDLFVLLTTKVFPSTSILLDFMVYRIVHLQAMARFASFSADVTFQISAELLLYADSIRL